MMNSNGEIGSPCHNPRFMLNSLDGLPLIRIDCLAEDTIEWTQVIHLFPDPMYWSVSGRNFQFMVSKAFSKSNLRMSPLVCYFCMMWTTSFVISIESTIWRPLIKADWFSAMILGRMVLSHLLSSTLRIIFIVVLIRLVGRKSNTSMGLIILGIKVKKDE